MKSPFSFSLRRIGSHSSMEEARAACAAQNGKVIDLDNYIDSFAALAPIFADFRITGSNEATCWEDGDGNRVDSDVAPNGPTGETQTLIYDGTTDGIIQLPESHELAVICQQDMPAGGELQCLMLD